MDEQPSSKKLKEAMGGMGTIPEQTHTTDAKPSRPELSLDLIFNILSRVQSVKTLVQCKMTCRLWYALIDHPCFIEMHLRRAKETPGYLMKANNRLLRNYARNNNIIRPLCFFREKDDHQERVLLEDKVVEVVFQPSEMGGGYYSITDSCNGLVCFTDFRPVGRIYISIYNPSTREYINLPEPPFPYKTLDLAFAYDPINKEYKVFRLFPHDDPLSDKLFSRYEVFTLGSNNGWRQKGIIPYVPNESKHMKADGSIHWLFGTKKTRHSILSIDISSETYRVYHPLPPSIYEEEEELYTPYLIDLNGKLALCLITTTREMEIWVKIADYPNDSSDWEKQYSFTLPEWIRRRPQVRMRVCSTSVRNNEIFLARGRTKLVFFNIETYHSRTVDTTLVGRSWADIHVVEHLETLVPCKFPRRAAQWPESMDILDRFFRAGTGLQLV